MSDSLMDGGNGLASLMPFFVPDLKNVSLQVNTDSTVVTATNTTVVEAPGCETDFTVIDGDIVCCTFQGYIRPESNTCTPRVSYRLDSDSWIVFAQQTKPSLHICSVNSSLYFTGLSAGSHKIEIGVSNDQVSNVTLRGNLSTPSTLWTLIFSGF
jgi:hypothetical protein